MAAEAGSLSIHDVGLTHLAAPVAVNTSEWKVCNDSAAGLGLSGTQRHRLHVAEIPNVIFHELLRRFGHWKHNQAAWKRWLNDPDNAAFRTWTGRV